MGALVEIVNGTYSDASNVNQYRTLFRSAFVYDVKNGYGATGIGAADDRAAIQSAIDACSAAGGGIVLFPPGTYLIGTPGLVLPSKMQTGMTLQGSGMNGEPACATALTRNGAYPIITASGTGTSSANKSHGLQVRDMTINGSGGTGNLVVANKAAGGTFDGVRFYSATRTAFTSDQLHNYVFRRCIFEGSGDLGTTTPAVYLGCPTEDDEQTATVMFDSCIFEANNYDDVQLTGGATRRATGVVFTNCKWERNVAGACINFSGAEYCQIIGGNMTQLYSNAAPMVKQSGGSIYNSLTGVFMQDYETIANPTTADYAVSLTDGDYFSIVGCTFIGSKTAHIRLGASCGPVNIAGNMHRCAGITYTAAPISDARTIESGISNTQAGALGTTGGDTRLISSVGGSTANDTSLGIRLIRIGDGTDWTTAAVRMSLDVDNVPYAGGYISIEPDGRVYTGGKFTATGGLGVGNSASATTPGSVTKKIEVFNAAGASLGYLAVYDAIT